MPCILLCSGDSFSLVNHLFNGLTHGKTAVYDSSFVSKSIPANIWALPTRLNEALLSVLVKLLLKIRWFFVDEAKKAKKTLFEYFTQNPVFFLKFEDHAAIQWNWHRKYDYES